MDYVGLEGTASIRHSPTQGAHKGSLDLALKPGEAQSPTEQTSGRVSKDRGRHRAYHLGLGDLPGCHPEGGVTFSLK